MLTARRMLLAAALAAPLAAQGEVRKVRVAILEIRALGTESAKAELLSEVALTEAASLPGFEVIGKSDINSIIGFEKQKKVMGCGDDSSCLAEIGGALGVEFILVGSVGTIGDLYRLDLKLVETRKAKVRARIGVTVEGKESKLVAAIQKAVRDLLIPETPKEQPRVAKVEPPQAPVAPPVVAPPPPAAPAKQPAKAEAPPPAPDRRLEARPEPPRSVVPVEPSPRPRESGSLESSGWGMSRRTWAYVAGGAGIALLAGGSLAGLQARSALDAQKSATTVSDYDSNKSKVKSMSKIADALFLGGAAGLGAGTWLYLTSGPSALAIQAAPVPGGAVASISGGF